MRNALLLYSMHSTIVRASYCKLHFTDGYLIRITQRSNSIVMLSLFLITVITALFNFNDWQTINCFWVTRECKNINFYKYKTPTQPLDFPTYHCKFFFQMVCWFCVPFLANCNIWVTTEDKLPGPWSVPVKGGGRSREIRAPQRGVRGPTTKKRNFSES